ncbi:MAG TPA: translation initiation factor IF-2 [Gemmatimonadaceae bacterium]|nr:translation initiation factor IF-2 [Gemmatimonadaceae bacterium]
MVLIKLRVHDLAGEFGIPSEELINMLRQLDVPVRSHMSELTDDQVSRLRARWEREKRARAEKPAAAPTRRRRGTAKTAAKLEKSDTAPAEASGKEPARQAEAPASSGGPVKVRRRKAADVAAAQAEQDAHDVAAADAAAEVAPPVAVEPPREAAPVAETEISRTPKLEPVAAAAAPSAAAAPEARPDRPAAPSVPAADDRPGQRRPATPSQEREPRQSVPAHASASTRSHTADVRRPTPVARDMPRRPMPVASATPFPSRPASAGGTPSSAGTAAPAGAPPARREEQRRGGKRKKGKRGSVDQEAVTQNIARTMGQMRAAPTRRGGRRDDGSAREELEAQRREMAERERKTVRVNEFITVSELAETLGISASQIVGFAFKNLGLMITINQRLDFDQIEMVAGEFGFQAMREEEYAAPAEEVAKDAPEDLNWRPPVVTIMGHVDHGKTSLLDYIRTATVVAGEAGGITQHIGAYHVSLPDRRAITFLDTPGHEAFTAMRARGAQVTDIVVLVVAADDQVMPQTIEAISHARNAGVPMVVAINKIDLPNANVPKVKQDLLQHGVVLEDFGGDTLHTQISAKKGTNVQELLDQILLQAEILDLKANADRRASGTVIEAQLDPGKGAVATVLVQNGTLRVGDDFIVGMYSGRVRALLDERGKIVKEAGPAIPVQVLGLNGTPTAGDQFIVVEDAQSARDIAQRRERLDREARSRRTTKGAVTLEDFMTQAAAGETRMLNLIIKADQGGPAEALADALQQLSNDEVQVDVIQRGVGAISESDILLAKTAGAIIIGFHVRPDTKARASAEREGVDIKLYRVIYDAVSDVRAALEGLLRPEERDVVTAEIEVREVFKVPKAGTIAGSFVRSGTVTRGNRIRVIRDGVEVYEGTIESLRRFKDDVREVREGFECGIGIANFNDIKLGDVLETYRTEEVARTLQPSPAS